LSCGGSSSKPCTRTSIPGWSCRRMRPVSKSFS